MAWKCTMRTLLSPMCITLDIEKLAIITLAIDEVFVVIIDVVSSRCCIILSLCYFHALFSMFAYLFQLCMKLGGFILKCISLQIKIKHICNVFH